MEKEQLGSLALYPWLLVALVTWPHHANTYSLRPSPGSRVHCKPRPSLASSSFKSFLACKAELRRPDRLLWARLQSQQPALCAVNLHICLTPSFLRSLLPPEFHHLLEKQSLCMVI